MYCKGDSIICEGELGMDMFYVLSGSVKITDKNGNFLAKVETGKSFGEIAIIDSLPDLRVANAVALEDSSLAILSKEKF